MKTICFETVKLEHDSRYIAYKKRRLEPVGLVTGIVGQKPCCHGFSFGGGGNGGCEKNNTTLCVDLLKELFLAFYNLK